jgi:glycosyltransferase involved in cell wall biosynthesis
MALQQRFGGQPARISATTARRPMMTLHTGGSTRRAVRDRSRPRSESDSTTTIARLVTSRSSGSPIRWTFLTTGLPRITGGLVAVYELANALSLAGDSVRVVHVPTPEAELHTTDEIPWFTFEPAVETRFLASLDPDLLPEADILFYTIMVVAVGTSSWAGDPGRRLVEQLGAPPTSAGLPILFVQGLGVFEPETEILALHEPGPKACVASWMVDNLVRAGFPPREAVLVVNGLDHDTFGVRRSISDRKPSVAMNLTPHPLKNMRGGIDALGMLYDELAVPSVLFGNHPPTGPVSAGIRYLNPPDKPAMAELYNRSSLYLQPSFKEGFGLAAVEAMACGCALVTTANGGSNDYAIDGETAVICETDPGAIADALGRLVRDDALRIRIATEGSRYAERFRWSASAAALRQLGEAYLAAPGEYLAARQLELDGSVIELTA